MAKKNHTRLPWFMFYASEYRSREIHGASLSVRAVYIELLAIMWCATDRRGYLERNGTPINDKVVSKMVAVGKQTYRKAKKILFEIGELKEDERGILYSTYLLELIDRQAVARENGKKGGNPVLLNRDNHTLNLEDKPPLILEPNKEKDLEINTHPNKDTDLDLDTSSHCDKQHSEIDFFPKVNGGKRAFWLRDYQEEVLNKCEGKAAGSEHPSRGMFFQIGRYVPEPLISKALEAVQDARLRNLDLENEEPVRDLCRYYIGIVKMMCLQEGIETPINWSIN